MSTEYLKRFFTPQSLLLVTDDISPQSFACKVLNNICESDFSGKFSVLSREPLTASAVSLDGIDDIDNLTDLSTLAWVPDLAIVCSDVRDVAGIARQLSERNVKAIMVLSRGYNQSGIRDQLHQALLDATRPYGTRVLGPECMGIIAPKQRLNASYSHVDIQAGKVAYVGQSDLLGAAMLDWAQGQGIGFSNFLTLGDAIDVDIASVIDHLAKDPYTQSLLVQVDRISGSARHFLSAIRAAARNKLVLVLKSDVIEAQQVAHITAPGLDDEDQAFDAAIRQAGAVRVDSSDRLFSGLETLTRMKPVRGARLAVISNGQGPIALAVDKLLKAGLSLAKLNEQTIATLNLELPFIWDGANPVNLQAEATPSMFATAAMIVAKDPNVDGILVLHAPTFFAPGPETADELVRVGRSTQRNILTCFMGRATAIDSRNRLAKGGIPTFITPEDCVEAFALMVEYQRNQDAMRLTPMLYEAQNTPNHIRAKLLVSEAIDQERDFLYHHEVTELLSLYEFPVVNSRYANTIEEVVEAAATLGGSVAVKALHKGNIYPFFYKRSFHQRWKDLAQDLYALNEVKHAVTKLAYRVGESYAPEDTLGYCVQTMKRGMQSMQMSLGITRDPIFGPLIIFGAGGAAVDVQADRQVMIPPLNSAQAKALILRSRISALLIENSTSLEEDLQTLSDALVRLSELLVDIPTIKCLEIHPMLLNKRGVLVIDAAASIGEPSEPAFSPYPEDLTEEVILRKSGRKAELRAIRGEDEPNHLTFFNSLSAESIRMRYFYSRGVPSHQELAMWTQIDYDREMAFIVTAPKPNSRANEQETLGVVRAVTDADNVSSEFAVVIRDDLQGEGLGMMLMQKAITYCKQRGTLEMMGSTLPANKGMQGLAKKLGFSNQYDAEEEVVYMRMSLNTATEDWQKLRLKH